MGCNLKKKTIYYVKKNLKINLYSSLFYILNNSFLITSFYIIICISNIHLYLNYIFAAVCSTPRVKEFIHSENLLATDVINRYIRMGSTSFSKLYFNFLFT